MKHFTVFLIIALLAAACDNDLQLPEILKYYGDAGEDAGYSLEAVDDGYYICGQLTEIIRESGPRITGSRAKPALIRTDLSGNRIWKINLAGKLPGAGSKVIIMADGTAICTGHVDDTLSLQTDIFVARVGTAGQVEGLNIFRYAGNQTALDILETDEGFMILGTTDVERSPVTDSTGNRAGYTDILLLRTDENLSLLDTPLPWGFPWNDRGVALKKENGGGYIIAGTTDRYASRGRKNDVFLLRINSLGGVVEYVILSNTGDENASALEVLDDGFLVAGTSVTSSAMQSAYFVKVPLNIFGAPEYPANPVRNVSWSVNSISRYGSNYFVAAGREGSAVSSDMLLFVVDRGGNIIEGMQRASGSAGIQVFYDVVTDHEGFIVAVGKNSYETNSMVSLLKMKF
jgi:hypothetical protein